MKDINVYRIERHEANGDVVSYGLIIGPRWLAREFARDLRRENDATYRERWLRTADAMDREVLGEDACRTLIWEDEPGGEVVSTVLKAPGEQGPDAGSTPAASTTYCDCEDTCMADHRPQGTECKGWDALDDPDTWEPDPRVRYDT